MATVIKLKIQVDELSNVLTQFDRIKVYRSTTGISGVYAELTVAATRIVMVQGVSLYEYDDTTGEITYYYKTSYFNSGDSTESSLSEPRLGDDPATANIMTVSELKEIYLFGVDLTNDSGEPFPNSIFDWGIRSAIAALERTLDILIRPTVLTERYDYYREDYQNWAFIPLNQYPIVSVTSVKMMWPLDTEALTFPSDWIQLRAKEGQINIIPGVGGISSMLITAGGAFLPILAGTQNFVPNLFEVIYTAGFAEGQVPQEIRDVIGKMAAFAPLNIAGDLIVGAGIANKSISIDGLSQSIGTTSSATNAGYGARLTQYSKELREVVPTLQRYYKGIRMTAL